MSKACDEFSFLFSTAKQERQGRIKLIVIDSVAFHFRQVGLFLTLFPHFILSLRMSSFYFSSYRIEIISLRSLA